MKKTVKWLAAVLALAVVIGCFGLALARQDQLMQELRYRLDTLERQNTQQALQTLTQSQQELTAQLEAMKSELFARQEEISALREQLDRLIRVSQGKLGDGEEFVLKSSPETYDYLAIGNSITRHAACDYWWNGQSGMAASTPEKDYFHQVSAGLETAGKPVNSYALPLFAWESTASDRAEMATLADMYLTEDLDLVTIQLGENARDLTTFESDYCYLIRHIRELAPNATVVVIGDFWRYEDRDEMKERAAAQCGAIFVSLREIMDDPAYMREMNSVVYDSEGGAHTVTHAGVTAHPGDAGMAYIASAVLDALAREE